MDDAIPTIAPAVRAAFAPVLRALAALRQALGKQPDIVAIRPGYDDTSVDQPTPAAVVAVIPGTSPVNAADLSRRFGVPVLVTEATVEEQLEATERAETPLSFSIVGGPMADSFEALLTEEDLTAFGPPKEGAYEQYRCLKT
jgi:hypothetical protein